MKFSTKLSLIILISGITVLCLFALVVFKISSNSVQKNQFQFTQTITNEISNDIETIFLEKIKTARTLANTPIIIKALESSNLLYAGSTDEKRDESIKFLNEKWKSITNPEDKFILKFTDNKVSLFLKNQQVLFPEEYGEIFLTNQFGALVASTSKLSTFAHSHKYWWVGAYNNGDGAVFLDDRGYDDSVGGYVLGLVIPVKKDSRIIGILKFNLNILGAVDKLLSRSKDEFMGKFKLSRSGGMIVFEEGFEPLSTQLPAPVIKNIKEKKNRPFLLNVSDKKYLVGFSEIALTKEEKGYGFGGIFESIDHKKGNTGESWYVLNYRPEHAIQAQSFELIKWIVLIGVIIILFLTAVSYFLGQTMAKPFKKLKKATEKIGAGNFEHKIDLKQFDNEFKNLASSFNIMTTRLLQTTTSIKQLEDEIDDHKKSKSEMVFERNRAQQYLDVAGVILVGLDMNQDVILINQKGCEILGYPEDEIIGKNWFDNFLPQENIPEIKKVYNTLITGETELVKFYENPILNKNGVIKIIAWHNSIIKDDSGQIISLLSSGENITERRQIEKNLQQAMYKLGERNKELNCLYEISKLTDESDISFDEIYPKLVVLIPSSMQSPEDICAKISVDSKEYKTENYKKTKWDLNKEIIVHGKCIGSLKVYYLNEKPDIDENPFLAEENNLVTTIARRLGRLIERMQGQKQIKTSLKEKEVLLSEIHHRVKNNMQVIISLLRLQSDKTDDKKYADLLQNSERRVLSMALVHEQLYQSGDYALIDLKEYFQNLLNDLFISHGVDKNTVELTIDCADIFFDLDNAVPCGLIVNELVSNCLKHAFPDKRKGKINIMVFCVKEDEFELSVSDDGAGIPKELDINNSGSMGIHLVKVLVEDTFEGKIELDRTEGTRFNLKLKKLKYKQRI